MTTAQITAGDYGEKTIVYYWDPIGLAYAVGTQPAGGGGTGLTDAQLRASAVPISAASLPLPTGASTSAAQTTGNASLSSIDTKTPALGQALAAAAVPVVLTVIQQAALTPPVAIVGFALEAGHLATIDTSTAKIPSQGQALAAASMPVVLPAAQITTLTPPAAITGFATETTLAGRLKPADTLAGVTTVTTVSTVTAVTAITNALPAGTNTLGSVKLTDGTNVATVKAASTAAVAADTAQVVALSPNNPVQAQPSTQFVTATGLAAAAVTLTIAAAGAGLFTYITSLHISRNATAALAGTATLVITSTNITGGPAWSVGNAMVAGGTQNDLVIAFASPVKTTTANTATTIVAPAPGAAVLWRINATYYTGP